jgi:hypothetical protein
MKTTISYNGTDGDVFFSIINKKIFTVEYDWEELIKLYNGRMYYFSKSLLSGEGLISKKDLIAVNNRFPGNFKNTSIFKIFYNEENRKNIYCFVDAGYSHKQFDGNIVLTDGNSIAICDEKSVVSIVNGWETVDWKKSYILAFDPHDGNPFRVEYFILNRCGVKINPARFLQDIVKFCEYEHPWVFHPRVNLYKVGENYYHRNKVGFFDKKWNFDPTKVPGENIGSWVVFHPGVVYARYDNTVAWIATADRKTFCGGKYAFEEEGVIPPLDYEANCSIWEFFDKTPEYFSSFLLKKAREDFVFSSKRITAENVKKILEEHQDGVLTVQDSFAVGNCELATNKFIKEFNVKENEGGVFNVKDILENPNINEMLKNYNFRKVIANKFT